MPTANTEARTCGFFSFYRRHYHHKLNTIKGGSVCGVLSGGPMLYFEIEWDEAQVRSFVKTIIDNYELGLFRHGSQQIATELTQAETIENMTKVADCVEELIEHKGMLH